MLDIKKKKEIKLQNYRVPSLFLNCLCVFFTITGLILVINHIFRLSLLGVFPGNLEYENSYFYLLFAFFLSQVFIYIPSTKKGLRSSVPWIDILLFFTTFIVSVYLAVRAYETSYRAWDIMPPWHMGISAVILCLLVLEALRRCGGLSLFIVCSFFAIYPMFANYGIGFTKGIQFSLYNTAAFYGLSRIGLLGTIIEVYGKILIGFLLFGVILDSTGGSKAFLDFAFSLFGKQKGGPAKVSIVGSALFGCLSGSVLSNIITTGSVTIPIMKKAGYKDYFAAAVETVASTGGNIMPPVMGATAFIMASFLGIPYFNLCMYALIPALLYYISLFIQVHFYALKNDLGGVNLKDIPSFKQVLKEILPYLFTLFVLVYYLYLGMESRAPFFAIITLIIIAMLKKEMKNNFISNLYSLFQNAQMTLVSMIGILTGIGFVVGALSITGLGGSFSHEIVMLAGANRLLILIFTAIGCLILGMGMPVAPSYIFLSIVIVPALLHTDINIISAHLFVFYMALTSYLTPPVALGAYTAASISGSDFLKTAIQSMRLGFIVYVIPFCFVYRPALLLQEPLNKLILPLFTILVGVILLAATFEGYLFKIGILNKFYRIIFFICGVLLIIPGYITDVVGISILILTLLIRFIVLFLRNSLSENLRGKKFTSRPR